MIIRLCSSVYMDGREFQTFAEIKWYREVVFFHFPRQPFLGPLPPVAAHMVHWYFLFPHVNMTLAGAGGRRKFISAADPAPDTKKESEIRASKFFDIVFVI